MNSKVTRSRRPAHQRGQHRQPGQEFPGLRSNRERNPCVTLENGHRSTSFAHLANISLAMKTRLEWDPVTERITNSEKANELLHYDYRDPWKL